MAFCLENLKIRSKENKKYRARVKKFLKTKATPVSCCGECYYTIFHDGVCQKCKSTNIITEFDGTWLDYLRKQHESYGGTTPFRQQYADAYKKYFKIEEFTKEEINAFYRYTTVFVLDY